MASINDEIYKRTITCSGVSKSYAMTGWRIGYTGSSVEIAKLMASVQSHQTSNPCSVAQKAALEAITGTQMPMEAMKIEFEHRRDYIYERVCNIPFLEALNPEGAFYLFVDLEQLIGRDYKGYGIKAVNQVADILLEDYNVVVIPCEDFGFPNFIRLSYAISREAITKGMDRIEEFIENFI
jgi:aspartate aminotransferase